MNNIKEGIRLRLLYIGTQFKLR